jgi:hypothetical protein
MNGSQAISKRLFFGGGDRVPKYLWGILKLKYLSSTVKIGATVWKFMNKKHTNIRSSLYTHRDISERFSFTCCHIVTFSDFNVPQHGKEKIY